MKRFFVVAFLLLLFFDLRAVEVFKGFSLNGDVVFYYQGGNLSQSNKLFPSSEKGFGNLIDVEAVYNFNDTFSIYTRFHNGNGQGADNYYSDFLFANVNTMADDNTDESYDVKLLEAYLNISFFSEKLKIILGKTEPFLFIDQNEFANDELSQFIGKPFVNNIFFDVEDRYSPVLGFIYTYKNLEFSGYIQSIEKHKVFYNGTNWVIEETGVHDFSKNYSTGFQVNVKKDINGLKGNYRVFVYNNSFAHFMFNEISHNPENLPDLSNANGFGISIDQFFTQRAGFFFRYGKSWKKVYEFKDFYSLGFNFFSVFVESDCFMFAFSKINPVDGLNLKDENHIEIQYKVDLMDNFTLSFDFQYVSNLINYPKLNLSVFTVRVARFF